VKRLYLAHERAILGVTGVILFLVLWEGFERGWWAELLGPLLGAQAARFQLKPIFISSPTRIARMAFDMFFVTGAIWKDIGWSSLEFMLGVALAFIIGIPLGLAAGWYRRFNYAVEPFLAALNATPQVAFLPLLILWVGSSAWREAFPRAMRCCSAASSCPARCRFCLPARGLPSGAA
jgi:ABC-type nitrate/sulfonate/bicarbonate transport system permease component